jgi:hypothetical protein
MLSTENLAASSYQFKRNATTLKREMRWKNIKLALILAAVVIGVVVLLIGALRGAPVTLGGRDH